MTVGPDFVFIAVPRTASKAIAQLWLPHYGGEPVPGCDHCVDVPSEHKNKFAFAVVRNPYDRMISLWYIAKVFRQFHGWSLCEFLTFCIGASSGLRICGSESDHFNSHWCSQTQLLGRHHVDRILRYENLEEGLQRLPFVRQWHPLQRGNVSANRPAWRMEATGRVRELIRLHSAADFEQFGYDDET